MKISTLDKMLPKRWSLLLRYYLPFFKKPEPFYFQCREFINDLKKRNNTQNFPLDKLPELLVILEFYSKNNSELIEFSKKIVGTLEEQQLQSIDLNRLKQSLSEHNLENNNQTPVLNELFKQLPELVYANEDRNEIENGIFTTIEKTKEFDIDTELNYLK